MIQLRDKESGEVLGAITEDDLQFLIDNLEEESEIELKSLDGSNRDMASSAIQTQKLHFFSPLSETTKK